MISQTLTKVNLIDLLAPAFYKPHHVIKKGQHAHHWFKGGRGSTKSSFISVEIIMGMMADPDANATVIRRVADTLQESVYDQILWAIDKLEVSHQWHTSVKPMRIVYKPTGQRISFKGGDKPKRIKATKFRRGYCKYLWYEEVDEFDSYADLRSINQSLIRGGEGIKVFYSFNPPESATNWVNAEVEKQALRKDTYVHHSDYTTVPPEWLGSQFIADAEHLKKVNPKKYEHEYLGAVTGTGAEVFTNLMMREITKEELATFDKIYRGLDHGYAADPMHYMENYYDKTRKRLFIFAEIHQARLSNDSAVKKIKKINKTNGPITADSAEPRTNNEFKTLGLQIIGAKKGPGSVEHGIKSLQDLEAIIIDPIRCPNTAREFRGYEVDRDKNGNLKGTYPDKNNHSIDSARYSLEKEFKNSKWLV